MVDICPVILAGGAGMRLWPLSRETYPKQLLRLHGDVSLLQQTARRLDGLEDTGTGSLNVRAPILVCHENHRFLIADQLEAAEPAAARILLEPVSRNTAPALTFAALAARELMGDPLMLVMPADHVIEDLPAFHAAVSAGVPAALGGAVVTFGIVPTRPETGFGYIHRANAAHCGSGAYPVANFVEKPDRETAEGYLETGDYLWNGGIFLLRPSVWLSALERYVPAIVSAALRSYEEGELDGSFFHLGASALETCPQDSIDYAVMERLAAEPSGGVGLRVVPLAAGWSDVGSWTAVQALGEADERGNVIYGDGLAIDSENSLTVADHRFVASIGVKDTIVVETADAVLVADKSRSQDVKRVVEWLKQSGREEGISHRRVYRPWGDYEQLDAGERFQVKRLTVKPGAALSLQQHHHRAEHWVVVRGTALVTRGDEQFILSENQSTYIPLGVTHRLENPGKMMLEVIEVQSGSYLGEDDIVRFEDRYNRGA